MKELSNWLNIGGSLFLYEINNNNIIIIIIIGRMGGLKSHYMFYQTGCCLCESCVTCFTFIKFLTSVNTLMCFQAAFLFKSLTTCITFIGFITLKLFNVPFLCKSTLSHLENLQFAVHKFYNANKLMYFQAYLPHYTSKFFTTPTTSMRLILQCE